MLFVHKISFLTNIAADHATVQQRMETVRTCLNIPGCCQDSQKLELQAARRLLWNLSACCRFGIDPSRFHSRDQPLLQQIKRESHWESAHVSLRPKGFAVICREAYRVQILKNEHSDIVQRSIRSSLPNDFERLLGRGGRNRCHQQCPLPRANYFPAFRM